MRRFVVSEGDFEVYADDIYEAVEAYVSDADAAREYAGLDPLGAPDRVTISGDEARADILWEDYDAVALYAED